MKINEVQLVKGTSDGINWKFTNSSSYTAASAYKTQFEGTIDSFMMDAVWKNWDSPKHKLFAWHILQNECGRPIIFIIVGGQIVAITNFAKGSPNLRRIFSSNAGTQ
jgi:hypothetical protein